MVALEGSLAVEPNKCAFDVPGVCILMNNLNSFSTLPNIQGCVSFAVRMIMRTVAYVTTISKDRDSCPGLQMHITFDSSSRSPVTNLIIPEARDLELHKSSALSFVLAGTDEASSN